MHLVTCHDFRLFFHTSDNVRLPYTLKSAARRLRHRRFPFNLCRRTVQITINFFVPNISDATLDHQRLSQRLGVTALEFDKQGIYLASGCLTVHDFETLYCQSFQPVIRPEKDGKKLVLHISLSNSIDVVCWNPANQHEIWWHVHPKTTMKFIYLILGIFLLNQLRH